MYEGGKKESINEYFWQASGKSGYIGGDDRRTMPSYFAHKEAQRLNRSLKIKYPCYQGVEF